MPLPPLESPRDPRVTLSALARISPVVAFLSTTLLGFNLAQLASAGLLPVAPGAFRAFNRWAANLWWGWCVTGSRVLNGVHLVVTGDQVPMRENAIVVLNHQQMADITFLMDYARTKDRLGDMKWFVKDIVKYVPGVGWGMLFIDCVFVKRDWAADQDSIRRTFARLKKARVPVWLIVFSEGTRMSPAKLARSQEHARSRGLSETRHVLVPRTKGFVATVEGLRGHVDAVYDVTIGYEQGVPTLGQFVLGYAPRAHLHVRRYPIDALPVAADQLATWLRDRFQEKDELLEQFYAHGAFPEQAAVSS